MSQQHKLRIVDNAREHPRGVALLAFERRRMIQARVFKSNIHDSAAPALDLDDMSQRSAQARHIGKTIDNIPQLPAQRN